MLFLEKTNLVNSLIKKDFESVNKRSSKKSAMGFIDRQWDFSRAGRKGISHVENETRTDILCWQPCFQAGTQAKRLQGIITTTSRHRSHCAWCQLTEKKPLYFQPSRKYSSSKERVWGAPEQTNTFSRSALFKTDLHFRYLQKRPANRMGTMLTKSQVERASKGVPKVAFPHNQINQN